MPRYRGGGKRGGERDQLRRQLIREVEDTFPEWAPWRVRRFERMWMRAAELAIIDNLKPEGPDGKPISARSRAETNRTIAEGVKIVRELRIKLRNDPIRKLAEHFRDEASGGNGPAVVVNTTPPEGEGDEEP